MAVKPGITGLWQISGRNDTTYRRRVALDTAYARSRSIQLDVAIIARTVPAVLFGSGCY
jgi:exopolysaccharide production protein ExoY